MSEIKQVLQLRKQGMGSKTISKNLGIARNTVKSLLAKVRESNWSFDELLILEDPVLESRLYAGNAAYSEERFNILKDRLEFYAAELEKPGVTKRLLWEEYRSEFPDGYGHSQFQFHLLQHLRAKKPSLVLEHQPGDKLLIDFAGKTINYINGETGEVIKCQLFVAVLPYSNYFFAMAVPSQKLEDFIYALTCCHNFLGGVPSLLVPDNMKTAVIKSNPYEPKINHALQDFANHYGTAVLPTRVARPRDKAAVEGHVKIAYMHIYARLRNQQFFSIDDLNRAIKEKVILLNKTRMQNKSYSREEKFLAEEKPLLKSLPSENFCIKHYRQYKVPDYNYIRLSEDSHYYSVPFRYIGQTVKVIYTRSLVEIYLKGERIAVHQRDRTLHGYTTLADHLASHHKHYLRRSPQYYIDRAAGLSDKLGELFTRIFEQPRHPETLYRSCNGILALCRKAGVEKLNKACDIALYTGNYSYGFIGNVIKNNMTEASPPTLSNTPLPKHNNIRGKDYYQQQLNLNL